MKTFYIVFHGTPKHHGPISSWVIRNTENDLNTAPGLMAEIEQIEIERGYDIVITYWKELPFYQNEFDNGG